MSAIVGIYYPDGRAVDCTDLRRMVANVAHRGRDGVGMWSEGPIGLGHRMLWTTRESLHEKPPLANLGGDLVITADARIDNRDELLDALDVRECPHQGLSDSQLILAAYEKWGERCPEHLLGDFAFAIWDRASRLMFCARDHFGVKPFYYYWSGKIFVFASEIKAILCLPEMPRRLNEVMLANYLGMLYEDKALTFYQDILRLPPAHSITVCREGCRLQSYWSLDPGFTLQLRSDAEYAAAFRHIFTEAVRCRLRSAFPAGTMLSGGLDSSSIACVARDLCAQDRGCPLHTFSVIFDAVPESDERHFIRAILDLGGFTPHFVHGDRLSPMTDLDRILWHEDEPFYGPNLFLNWGVWAAAQQQGVRVLLDGLMGDNVVSHGFAYLHELARRWRWMRLARELKALAGRRHRRPWRFLGRYIWNDGLKPLVPNPVRRAWRALYGRQAPEEGLSPIIDFDFARRVGLVDRLRRLDAVRLRGLRSEREDHYQGLISGMIPLAMEVANRGAAVFSIEVRYPFLDRRLVEFCLALPAEQKLHDGWTRMVARRALANRLPDNVCWRVDKGDLGPNFIRGLVSEREILDEVIFNGPKFIGRYVDVAALRKRYEELISRVMMNDDDILAIFLAVMLELWFHRMGGAPEASGLGGNRVYGSMNSE